MAHLIWAAKINNKVQHIRNVIQFVYLLKNNIIQYLLKIRDFASTPQENTRIALEIMFEKKVDYFFSS